MTKYRFCEINNNYIKIKTFCMYVVFVIASNVCLRHLGITRQTCWLIRCLIMDENRQVHANCYPISKFDGLVSERRSLFWVREFAPCIIEKNTPFSRKWVRALIYALIGRGRFINPYAKHMLKYHFQFFACFVCSFFMSSLLSMFHEPYCRDTLLVLWFLWQSRRI